jgi:hypothetical protein
MIRIVLQVNAKIGIFLHTANGNQPVATYRKVKETK